MNKIKFANLIELLDDFEADQICYEEECYEEEWHGDNEESPYSNYLKMLRDAVCHEVKISTVFSRFLTYNWNGSDEKLPWNDTTKLPFDPTLINVIIPITCNSLIQIRGENRKVVLTQPATYRGTKPFYHVLCASEKQLDNVRVLDYALNRPFYGIERIFEAGGFETLPELNKFRGLGMIHVDKQKIIIPETSHTYF